LAFTSDPVLTPAESVVVNLAGPGAATQLSIATQPVAGINGAALGTQPVVHVLDAQSNIVTTDNATEVTVSIGEGDGGTLGGTLTVTAVNGVATFSGVTLTEIGRAACREGV